MAAEVKQRNNRVFVLVGAVVAVAAFLAVIFISRGSNGSGSGAGPTTTIVVAKVDLPQGHQLTAGDLTTKAFPADTVPANAYPDTSALLNPPKYLAVGVAANTPITANLLVADKAAAQTAALSAQPLDISKGFVALAIHAGADVQQVACNIHPEDHIDMLIDPGNGSVRYGFQDVRVLSVGDYGAATTGCPSVLVVELPRAQAEELAFVDAQKGPQRIVAFVLRPHAEYGKNGQWPSNYEADGDPGVPQPVDAPVNAGSFNQIFPPTR